MLKRTMGLFVALLLVVATTVIAGDSALGEAIAYLIDREPGHPKKGDLGWSEGIATALREAATLYHRDPWLLASMGNWESRFRPDILSGKTRGKAGEIGILQCGKDCARTCPHFMDDVAGQAKCGARWLDKAAQACAADGQAGMLTYYATGMVCKVDAYDPPFCRLEDDPEACVDKERGRVRSAVRRRLRLAERLRDRFGG